MHETITQIIVSITTVFTLLFAIIGKILKNSIDKNRIDKNRIDKNEAAITETRTILFKEYATKTEVNTSVDRIITQLNRIENKLDHKKDK